MWSLIEIISLVVINKKSKHEIITFGIINKLKDMITNNYNLGKLKEKKENIPNHKLPFSLSTGFWIKECCSSLSTEVSLLFLAFCSKLSTLIFITCTGWFII